MGPRTFLKLAAIAAFVTAVTTLGVHFISFPAETFEDRLLLARDTSYLAHRWMIILHCLMVIVSMCGIAVLGWQYNRGLAGLGFLFFSVFGIAEITRMFSVLVYLNPMREKYLEAADPAIQQFIQLQIEAFVQGSTVLFLVFIMAFALGNLFYGLIYVRAHGYDRFLGWLLLLNALTAIMSFTNTFISLPFADHIVEWSGKYYQPLIRLVIGFWLWRKSTA